MALDGYADALRNARSGPLAEQEGVTAEDTRNAFQRGEYIAREVADKNASKARAYQSAHQGISNLRDELTEIAAQGNKEIERIQASKEPVGIKIAKIVDLVMQSQSDANGKAGKHAANLYSAIQQVLDKEDFPGSASQFAENNGVKLDEAWKSGSRDELRRQVTSMLDNTSSNGEPPNAGVIRNGATGDLDTFSSGHSLNNSSGTKTGSSTGAGVSAPSNVVPQNADTPAQLVSKPASVSSPTLTPAGTGTTPSPTPPLGRTTAPLPSSTPSTATNVAAVGPSAPNIAMAHNPAGSISSTPANALTPEGLAQNFNAGAQAGSPMSAGGEALSTGAMHAMQPQAPLHSEGMAPPPIAPTAPSSGTPIFETAHAAAPLDTPQPTAPPIADATQTVVATPAAQAPVMPSTAAPSIAPAGPLPAYGADLRPPAATTPAGPPPLPSAAPGSAPVNPTTASSLSQPAVVRQQPTPVASPSPAGLTENAVAATATGAVAGAGATQSQAQQRLQRLLDAVARQEPNLRWAIGDRDDTTTILVTDLASGWIPPHIDIPTGITLLLPDHRRPNLQALLGGAALTATYTPGQYIAPAADAEPVSMSIRARRTADVEELGWELAQATKWRDGLPRLAHTLAKAASTGTGYLDSEVELLREHLTAVSRRVLGDYPDRVDAATVGNWQLLATINALIKGEKTAANYHLAWFQTLNLAARREVHR